jgi:cytochrome c oxidase cbb3-type subunit 1
MLRSFDDYGNLAYTFIESVEFMHTPYVWRALGGAFFVTGVLVMVYNMVMTLRAAGRERVDEEARLAAKLAKA